MSAKRPRLGIRHLTVVPANYDAPSEDASSAPDAADESRDPREATDDETGPRR